MCFKKKSDIELNSEFLLCVINYLLEVLATLSSPMFLNTFVGGQSQYTNVNLITAKAVPSVPRVIARHRKGVVLNCVCKVRSLFGQKLIDNYWGGI
jgi:hypothetical protein